jgi:dipeptidyl aminopeptidase/acylaminoacyl peptidase
LLQSSDMWRRLTFLLVACLVASAQKRPFDANAMMELKRISDPQLSPDGKWMTFTVQTVDVAANKKPTQIWIVAGPDGSGAAPRQITHDGESNQRARWSPDSKRIAYISDRGGSSQIWLMDPDGGNAKQVTNVSTEADGELFAPDGKNLLFTSDVYPELRRRRCLQSKPPRRRQSQQGSRPHLHRIAVSSLDAMADRAPQPLAGSARDRRTGQGPHARKNTFRRSRWAVLTITIFRPTARKSATP